MADALNDEEIEYLKLVAFVFLRHGKWEKARVLYDLLREIAPEDLQVLKGLGLACLETGKLPQSLEYVNLWMEQSGSEEEIKEAKMLKARIIWHMKKREEAGANMDPERNKR